MSDAPRKAQVFESSRASVYAWAMRIVRNHDDAMDVTQDVWLRWLDHAASRRLDNPLGWLRRTTVNRAIDLLRGRKAAAAIKPDPPATSADPVTRAVEAGELRTAVASAIASLSPAQQRVLTAKVFENMTFAQIAAEQGISASTAKTHFVRALEAVRDALRPHWPPTES